MNLKSKRGFTLIELLVVIAIIGILSSVVLASLNSARTKGNDAKVKGQITNGRSAAELYNSTNGTYGAATAVCSAGMFTDAASGLAGLVNASNYPSGTTIYCGSSGTAYAIAANLSTGSYACVDSTGLSTTTTILESATTQVVSATTPHC